MAAVASKKIEEVVPSQTQSAPNVEVNTLLSQRNILKSEKAELKGQIADLAYDNLTEPQRADAEAKIWATYAEHEATYKANVAATKKKINDLKAEIREVKASNRAELQKIEETEKNPSEAEIAKARGVYQDALAKENEDFEAFVAKNQSDASEISTVAKEKDSELRAQYATLKKTGMKRAEKAEKLDTLKGEIYTNSGTADLKLMDLKTALNVRKVQHKKTLTKLKNDLDLETNHVHTLIKNRQTEQKAALKNYKGIDYLREEYQQVSPLHYRTVMGVKKWGIDLGQRTKASFSSWPAFGNWLVHNAIYLTIIAMIIYVEIYRFGISGKSWLNTGSIVNILKHTNALLPLALGVAGTIVLTGTDLSLGRIYGLTACLSAILLGFSSSSGVVFPWTENMPWIWIIVVLLIVMVIGGLLGAFNGFFVAKFSIHPFVVTLASQLVIYGLLLLMGDVFHFSVTSQSTYSISGWYNDIISSGFYLGEVKVEWYNLYAIVLLFVMWFIWNKTKFGKSMFAVGCNPDAANVSGINVNRTLLWTFVLAGVCYGFAGFEYNPINGGAQLGTGAGGELDPITAAVIGGVSFTGGIGKVSGVLIGCLLLKVIDSALLACAVPTAWQSIIKGAIILFAVAIDMKKYIAKK
jgi:methyl-galactoside transport system permease protein